jgi:hypothetical protein
LSHYKGVKFASAILILILITSIVIGVVLAANQYHTGGTQLTSSYQSPGGLGQSFYSYEVTGINSDGDLLAIEYGSMMDESEHPYLLYFIAVSNQGNLVWRTGHNGYCSISEGSDGNYYYVDFMNKMDIVDDSMWRWGNLTSLDHQGRYRWSHVEMEGDMDYLGLYPDNTVATCLRHSDGRVAILGISSDGSKEWSYLLPHDPNSSYSRAWMNLNGTLSVEISSYYDDQNHDYTIGIDQEGNAVWKDKWSDDAWAIANFPKSHNGNIFYEFVEEIMDKETSVYYVKAYDLVNGTTVWNTTLGYSDNPRGFPPGFRFISGTLVDEDGTIYVDGSQYYDVDFLDNEIFGIDPDGIIQWNRYEESSIVDRYVTGGLLLRDGLKLTKIGSDGGTIWRYYLDESDFEWSNINVELGPDGTIYVDGTSILMYDQVSISNSVILIIVLVLVDIAAISVFVWYSHKEKGRGQ